MFVCATSVWQSARLFDPSGWQAQVWLLNCVPGPHCTRSPPRHSHPQLFSDHCTPDRVSVTTANSTDGTQTGFQSLCPAWWSVLLAQSRFSVARSGRQRQAQVSAVKWWRAEQEAGPSPHSHRQGPRWYSSSAVTSINISRIRSHSCCQLISQNSPILSIMLYSSHVRAWSLCSCSRVCY